MKKILLATTLALVSAGSAFAMHDTGLNSLDRAQINEQVPGADLSNLSASQIKALEEALVLYSTKAEENISGRISLILQQG